jgi:hypothetical protein
VNEDSKDKTLACFFYCDKL